MPETFARTGTAITSTATVTVVSAATSEVSLVRSLTLHNNHTANTAAVTVVVANTSTAAELVIARYTQVTCHQTIQVLDQALVLNSGNVLLVKADPVNDLHAVASLLRIT